MHTYLAFSVTKIFAVAAFLFATSAFAQSQMSTSESKTVADNDVISLWIGKYEPAHSERGPKKNVLTVHKEMFSWGDCKDTSIHQIFVSEKEFVFKADPKAKCAWAGWIVRLNTSTAGSYTAVDTYRNMSDFESKRYAAHYSFEKDMK